MFHQITSFFSARKKSKETNPPEKGRTNVRKETKSQLMNDVVAFFERNAVIRKTLLGYNPEEDVFVNGGGISVLIVAETETFCFVGRAEAHEIDMLQAMFRDIREHQSA